jgi:hypothetical protein
MSGASGPHEASMKSEEDDLHGKPLIGRQLLSVEKKDYTWFFGFGTDVSLATESPWRLIDQNRIVVSSADHDQKFGLPVAVDAAQEVMSRVARRTVESAVVAADSGDLTVQFAGRICLQLLQLSSGYESWRLWAEGGESICVGGGGIVRVPES